VSGGVASANMGFFLYRGGVVSANCGGKFNHAITIVGYGTLNGMDYWLVKNSWGEYWGDHGYIRIQRTEAYPGICGILILNSIPIL
jgi:KDEL-tailed cysteine endopeptidase